MKRSMSESGASSSHPSSKQPKTQVEHKNAEGDKESGIFDDVSYLKHQNREMDTERRRLRRQEGVLEAALEEAKTNQAHFEATLSAVARTWNQVLADVSTAASAVGAGPRPLTAKVDEDEVSIEVENGDTVLTETGQTTEQALMSNLLKVPAELLALDATDSKSADKVLEDKGVKLEPAVNTSNTSWKSSSAFIRMDSDGYGVTDGADNDKEGDTEDGSGENVTLQQRQEKLEDSLREKARFTAQLAGSMYQAMQAHLMSLPPEARKTVINTVQLDLLAQRRTAEARAAFFGDQLTQSRNRCRELAKSVTTLREESRKAYRKLDKLAADGVEIPSDNNASTWVSSAGASKGSHAASGAGSGQVVTGKGSCGKSGPGTPSINGKEPMDPESEEALRASLQEAQALAEARQGEVDQLRESKGQVDLELTRLKSYTELDPAKSDLSTHPQYQRMSTQLESEQDMLKMEKSRVAELEEQLAHMTSLVQQGEAALAHQMEQQRLRWKSEIVSSNAMLNTAHEDLERSQNKLRQEQRAGSTLLQSALVQRDEGARLLQHTEQQVSILKASLERAMKDRQHAEAQAARDRSRLEKQMNGTSSGSREEDVLKTRLAESARELAESKGVQDALQTELSTTLLAYEGTKEGNSKLLQEISRVNQLHKALGDELTVAKMQLKNKQQIKATLEFQIKTAAQMRDQGHALKQKALELVAEAERKIEHERQLVLQLQSEVHTEKTHADRARQEVDALTQSKQAIEASHSILREHAEGLNTKTQGLEADVERLKEQGATLTRKLDKSRAHTLKLSAAVAAGANARGLVDDEMVQEELAELRKMIKCSVCQVRKKNRVITKCYHMFCDECVSQNLKVRNRKCPACARGFGQDDVREIWLT